MTYTSTKIKDFKVGERFEYYSAIFEVIDDCQTWTRHRHENDNVPCYGRHCKFISYTDGSGKKGDGLLEGYEWMQGTEVVTYAKI